MGFQNISDQSGDQSIRCAVLRRSLRPSVADDLGDGFVNAAGTTTRLGDENKSPGWVIRDWVEPAASPAIVRNAAESGSDFIALAAPRRT